jgi:hypothetical protein
VLASKVREIKVRTSSTNVLRNQVNSTSLHIFNKA